MSLPLTTESDLERILIRLVKRCDYLEAENRALRRFAERHSSLSDDQILIPDFVIDRKVEAEAALSAADHIRSQARAELT